VLIFSNWGRLDLQTCPRRLALPYTPLIPPLGDELETVSSFGGGCG
jgi:hypothetical protein